MESVVKCGIRGADTRTSKTNSNDTFSLDVGFIQDSCNVLSQITLHTPTLRSLRRHTPWMRGVALLKNSQCTNKAYPCIYGGRRRGKLELLGGCLQNGGEKQGVNTHTSMVTSKTF